MPERRRIDLAPREPSQPAEKLESEKQKRIVLEIGAGAVPAPVKGEWPSAPFDLYIAGDRHADTLSLLATENLEKLARKDKRAEKIHLAAFDAKKMPFADSSIDEVVARNVFTIATEQMEEILREIYRVLKNGGKLTIAETYTPDWLPKNFVRVVEHFSGLKLVGENTVVEAYQSRKRNVPIKLEFKKP